jgi:hypothetical protein
MDLLLHVIPCCEIVIYFSKVSQFRNIPVKLYFLFYAALTIIKRHIGDLALPLSRKFKSSL